MSASTLSERDREILDVERLWWEHAGAKETVVRDKFGVSMTAYYQRLNQIIGTEAALAFDPLLVKRLLKRRGARERSRSARRIGVDL